MNIDFNSPDWENARIVFDFFKQQSTCFDSGGLLKVEPKYVVAIDDDMASAFYAATIMEYAKRQFGKYPRMLCVGGTGMFSKYLNRLNDGTILSEGMHLRLTAVQIGSSAYPISVLDSGTNIYANLKEIIDYLADKDDLEAPIIFCPTQRLSKRLERIVAFTTYQFPGTCPLNAYYYVPDEEIKDVCQLYNGKALAYGLPLLSEAAALYDRIGTEHYVGRYMAEYDAMIPKFVHIAGQKLVEKYPLHVFRSVLSAPLQFLKIRWNLQMRQKEIVQDLEHMISLWKQQI